MNFLYFCPIMKTIGLKYKVIKGKGQYDTYCNTLEQLLSQEVSAGIQDEIDLLTLLIESYDAAHCTFAEIDPIQLLHSFMADHHLKPQHLTSILSVGKGYISDILNYKKGLSKKVIRKLAEHFKVRQEAFNRPYNLVT